jgi:nickel transport protein
MQYKFRTTTKDKTTIMKAAQRLLVATIAASLCSLAQAHGIWFAQRAGSLALVYGDGAEDLDVVKRMPKITSLGGLDASGKPVEAQLVVEGRMAFVNLAQKPVVLTASMNNGLWSRDAAGQWHSKGKDEVPNAMISGRFLKYATHLVVLPAGALAPAPGLALQIVPVGATFPKNKNEPLTVQVLFEGKPLPRAKVWQDVVTDPDAEALVSDANGRVTLPVRNQGLNVVKAEHESAPIDAGKASITHHFATLSFSLEHAPE